MKNIFVLFLFIIASNIAFSQWTNLNPVPEGNDLTSVFFTDDNTGWIVGSEGFVSSTTNAGQEWIQQNSGTTVFLNAVKFVNQTTGWIAGNEGTIIKTTDGGINWSMQTSGTGQNLIDLYFYDSNTGWAVGDNGTILKTTNGGYDWDLTTIGNITELTSVDFINASAGWAVGFTGDKLSGTGVLLKTTDGGGSWKNITSTPIDQFSLYCVDFVDENNGWLGGGDGRTELMSSTTDGGNSWNESSVLAGGIQSYGVQDIYFKDANTGYALRRITDEEVDIIRTTDGGLNWMQCPGVLFPEDNLTMCSLFVTGSGTLWAVGVSGKIMTSADDGETFSENLRTDIYTEHMINSVFFIDENTGWAAGKYSPPVVPGEFPIILKTTDSGKYWIKERIGNLHGKLNDLFFINQSIGWAIGAKGLVATTDGGENWSERCSFDNVTNNYNSIFFINQDIGWAINNGSNKGIYKTTDGGYSWYLKIDQPGSSIYFADANNGWAVGQGGLILKSTDGGENWVSKTSGTTEDLKKVKFFNLDIGLSVGNAGTVLLTTDGGENWISKNSGTIEDLSSISFVNSTSAWVGGTNGKILSTTDSGDNWTSYDNVTNSSIISLGFFNEHSGWLAGGSIFNYFYETVGITEPIAGGLPASYELCQNFPNPFNPGTTIKFSISKESNVNLSIYNVLGELVSTLVDEEMMPGNYKFEFNASALASGLYLYRFEAGDYVETKKMVLLK